MVRGQLVSTSRLPVSSLWASAILACRGTDTRTVLNYNACNMREGSLDAGLHKTDRTGRVNDHETQTDKAINTTKQRLTVEATPRIEIRENYLLNTEPYY